MKLIVIFEEVTYQSSVSIQCKFSLFVNQALLPLVNEADKVINCFYFLTDFSYRRVERFDQ